MENTMQNTNTVVTPFVIAVLTKDGIKFGTALTPDGRVAKNQALLDKAIKDGLPRIKIVPSTGQISFLSQRDAYLAGKMKKLPLPFDQIVGTFKGKTPKDIVQNMVSGNRIDDDVLELTPDMVELDDNLISF
tara:strand:+ start:657 stop:1052 length:396 start_codon:yes stop_codon:yes gene_type:complete